MENRELDLLEQSALLNSKEDFSVWEQRCNEYLESLKEEHSQAKEPPLSFGIKHSLITRIARLEDLIDSIRKRFEHAGARKDDDDNAELRWHEIDTAFESCILTGAVVNSKHIEPRKFLEDAKDIVLDNVRNVMQRYNANIKINTVFNGEFVTSDKRAKKSVDTKNCELLRMSDLREWYELHVTEPTLASLEEFQERDSGWTLSRILNLTVNVNKYQPMHAGCWIELPQEVKLKKAVVNVHSKDNACFAWSVVAALHPSEKRTERESSYPHYSSVLNLQEIEFPMTLSQIKTFEHFNNVSINVYCVERKEELVILPMLLADEKKDKHVNLLYLQDTRNSNMGHFAWIKNLSRLMSSQVSKEKKKKFFCDRCLHYFSSNAKLAAHPANCREMNDCAIKLPHKSFRWLSFNNDNRKYRVPFVVFADLKFTLKKTDSDAQTSTYQHHQIFSIGYYVRCAYDDSLSVYRFRRDKDCLTWFAEELRRVARNVKSILSGNVHNRFPATDFTHKDLQCIPVVLHDLSGYDAHLIINEITTAYEGGVEVLPITKEKYISFTKNFHVKSTVDNEKVFMKLRFIDSYKFFKTSLDKSVSFLNKDKLRILQNEFCKLPREHFDLLIRKGVFPHEYIDCVEKLEDLCLPPRESFYSSLTGDIVPESDYAHAVDVWQRFSIQTLGQYSDLYLKTDVLLLADMFENFRDSCISSYKLDPAYYCTLSDFTWDAMLKHTRVNFALLTDIDMVMFIERGTRGGLNQCSNRYARANNKYMQSYDSSKPPSYLMYFDINNLYGWAMCQPLPYSDFRWVKIISDFDVTTVALDSPTGYILEVDLEYPQYLHDAHSDLPFCPTRDKPPGKRQDKLLATLYDKKHYIIHYRNLQQCIRHGLRVTKIHRVLQFAQSPWLRDYIELNTKFGTLAKNDFEKNLYELMNIALFSKFTENVRNQPDVRLVTKWNGRFGAEAMIAKPNFRGRSVFSENAVAIEMQKLEVKFNKPIYVGMCILDMSKTCLYEFHYKYMLPLHREKCKVMYTDTDSIIYHIECDDVYDTMKRDIDKYDTSDYAVDNAYGIPLANEKVPGLIKDKNHGAIMTEFVGIRAKMYALRVDGKKDTNEIKSEIKSNVVAKEITFDDYTLCLRDEIEMTRQQSSVKSELDEVHYTITNTKIALNSYDDKRYIVPNSTETLPWGHYEIPFGRRNGNSWIANFSMDTINLPPTTLSEVATILQNGMRPAFREVNVDISACPCLTRKPFDLTGIGLSGHPSIIHVGDYINIIPTPRPNKATWNIGKMCGKLLSTGYDSFIIGSGYAVKPYMPYNGHLIMDAMCRAPFINNGSRIVFADASNGQTRIEMLTRPDQMMCSFMGNFFISEGKQGNVLRVRAKGRESIVDIITIIQSILHRHFYEEDRTVALGGVLQMRNGRVAQNVMPEQYPPRVSSFIDLARWFKCHDLQLKSDLIAVGTIINTEPDILYEEQRYDSPLPRRHHQFHSFSTDGVGGQFVNDIMSTVEYEGYFNLASKIYMWNS